MTAKANSHVLFSAKTDENHAHKLTHVNSQERLVKISKLAGFN